MKKIINRSAALGFMAVVAACFIGTTKMQAQQFAVQGDLVSSYV